MRSVLLLAVVALVVAFVPSGSASAANADETLGDAGGMPLIEPWFPPINEVELPVWSREYETPGVRIPPACDFAPCGPARIEPDTAEIGVPVIHERRDVRIIRQCPLGLTCVGPYEHPVEVGPTPPVGPVRHETPGAATPHVCEVASEACGSSPELVPSQRVSTPGARVFVSWTDAEYRVGLGDGSPFVDFVMTFTVEVDADRTSVRQTVPIWI